jgi:hypothetical protein
MITAVRKLGKEGMYLNIVETMHDKPIANIMFHGEKLKSLFLNSEMRKGDHSSHSYSIWSWNS